MELMSNPLAATSLATTMDLHFGVRSDSSELMRDFYLTLKGQKED